MQDEDPAPVFDDLDDERSVRHANQAVRDTTQYRVVDSQVIGLVRRPARLGLIEREFADDGGAAPDAGEIDRVGRRWRALGRCLGRRAPRPAWFSHFRHRSGQDAVLQPALENAQVLPVADIGPVEIEADAIAFQTQQIDGTAVDIDAQAVARRLDRQRTVGRASRIALLEPQQPFADKPALPARLTSPARRQGQESV